MRALHEHAKAHGEVSDAAMQAQVAQYIDLDLFMEEQTGEKNKAGGKPLEQMVLNRRRAVLVSHQRARGNASWTCQAAQQFLRMALLQMVVVLLQMVVAALVLCPWSPTPLPLPCPCPPLKMTVPKAAPHSSSSATPRPSTPLRAAGAAAATAVGVARALAPHHRPARLPRH